MKFKAKIRKIGHGKHIYIPQEVYTELEEGKEYDWEVYTGKENQTQMVYTDKIEATKVYTPVSGEEFIRPNFNTEPCSKHVGSMKGTCGCK